MRVDVHAYRESAHNGGALGESRKAAYHLPAPLLPVVVAIPGADHGDALARGENIFERGFAPYI